MIDGFEVLVCWPEFVCLFEKIVCLMVSLHFWDHIHVDAEKIPSDLTRKSEMIDKIDGKINFLK